MKKIFFTLAIIVVITLIFIRKHKTTTWKIAKNSINTPWAQQVNPKKPWPEYPRPDLVRKEWQNLNGLWDYAITSEGETPKKWGGKILVPYPIESALSGVKKSVSGRENLWYKTIFTLPKNWENKQIILNFEASDWETKVWINGQEVGIHQGGYNPFSFNISSFLNKNKDNEILICVWDATGKQQTTGKQSLNPENIFYTSSTGLWQTVWLEPVNDTYFSSFRYTSNIDTNTISFNTKTNNLTNMDVNVTIYNQNKIIASGLGKANSEIIVHIDQPILWTPDNPFLYQATIVLKDQENIIDQISSPIGMRKISLGKDKDGFTKILINNEFIFQNGVLDQGYWPDGIYTPPTDEAMVYDLKIIKEMGFNMIRKHVKIENRRFYNWCDQMGILVWQDMPNGDNSKIDSPFHFKNELKNLIETKYNHPSIIVWTPFNEGWGQFETAEITNLIKEYDPSRLINSVSGKGDVGTGDIKDIHSYPIPIKITPEKNRAIIIGEYGGLGFPVKDHIWKEQNWSYEKITNTTELTQKYTEFSNQIHKFAKEKGLSGSVYTQITDVETETNGLMTYDRKINKIDINEINKINSQF